MSAHSKISSQDRDDAVPEVKRIARYFFKIGNRQSLTTSDLSLSSDVGTGIALLLADRRKIFKSNKRPYSI
jgi:hypothetical protein